MDLGLAGKTALVTGDPGGSALAARSTDRGRMRRAPWPPGTARCWQRPRPGCAPAVAAVEVHAIDLSVSGSADALLATAGVPDILVNNAGAIPGGSVEAVDEARWRDAWDLKVFGYINLCRAAFAAMKDRGGGVIVNVTGLAADRTDFDYIAGTAGNASLNAFTRALGRPVDRGRRACSGGVPGRGRDGSPSWTDEDKGARRAR